MRFLFILISTILIIGFQNCSRVEFGADNFGSDISNVSCSANECNPILEVDLSDTLPIVEVPDQPISRIINQDESSSSKDESSSSKDESSSSKDESSSSKLMQLCAFYTSSNQVKNLENKNFRSNGSYPQIAIQDADEVSVNGAIDQLIIDGANYVRVNGKIGSSCIYANDIKGMNGGSFGKDVVLIGKVNENKDRAFTHTVNGNGNGKIIIKDMDVSVINGVFKEVHLINSNVEIFNGSSKKVIIDMDSSIDRSNGQLNVVNAPL